MSANPSTDGEPGRKLWVFGLVALVLVLGAWYLIRERGDKLATMTAVEAHLSFGAEAGEPVTDVEKGRTTELYYHVVLTGVPLGWTLQLRCEWVEPGGKIARQNVYETRFIRRSLWPTHCRQAFGPASASGAWHVRLLSDQRVLSTSSFVLR